ncbi:MAG: ECF transporter S component, partial [Firmicutes bacterium]|nr:ECF transporter S component [Bacillota bacterium]
ITPLYMGVPRETVAGMLLPVFLPFNVVKGVLNMAFTLMLYAPIISSLRKAGLVERSASGSKKSHNLGGYLVWLLMLATGILAVLVLNGKL